MHVLHRLQMASMLEGGGKTPVLSPEVLEAMGFKLVAYPLSLLGVRQAGPPSPSLVCHLQHHMFDVSIHNFEWEYIHLVVFFVLM